MTQPLPFSEDHRDCLQEIANVAMGAAGESLAGFTQSFVELSIPVIRYGKPRDIPQALASLQGADRVSAVVQPFRNDEREGYALVVITESSFNDLAEFTGRSVSNDKVAAELLSELAWTINGTCLPGLAEALETEVEVDKPEVVSLHVDLDDLRLHDIAGWDSVVSVEINYHLENHPFNCDLLLLYPDQAVDYLVIALDALLA